MFNIRSCFGRSGLKMLVAVVWGALILTAIVTWYRTGLALDQIISLLQQWLAQYGWQAAILYIFLYAIRPLIFFPATALTALSGVLWGPVWGILFTIVGENLSANFAFGLSRWLGRSHINISSGQSKFFAKMNKQIHENGFITVLLLRLLYVPFDLTNYGCGLTSVRWRSYAVATALGIIPGLVTFVLIGSAVGEAIGMSGEGIPWIKISVLMGLSLLIFIPSLLLSRYLKKHHQGLSMEEEKSSK